MDSARPSGISSLEQSSYSAPNSSEKSFLKRFKATFRTTLKKRIEAFSIFTKSLSTPTYIHLDSKEAPDLSESLDKKTSSCQENNDEEPNALILEVRSSASLSGAKVQNDATSLLKSKEREISSSPSLSPILKSASWASGRLSRRPSSSSLPSAPHPTPTSREPTPSTLKSLLHASRLFRCNPGLPLMVINTFFSSIISFSVKVLSSQPYHYPSYELVFVRSTILFSISAVTLKWYYRASDVLFGPFKFRKLLLLRSLLGFSAVITYYASLQYLKLDEATVLAFTSPFFVGILGYFILKEIWEKVDIFAGLLSLLGVLIIAKPELFHLSSLPTSSSDLTALVPSTNRVFAFGLGFFSSVSAAGVVITLRRLKEVPMLHILATFSLCSMVFSFLLCAVFGGHWNPLLVVPATWQEYVLLIFPLSLSAFVSQLALAVALRYETAAKCTSVSFLQLFFSFLLEIMFLSSAPLASEYLGAIIIMVSAVMVSISKLKKEKKHSVSKPASAPSNSNKCQAA